MRQDFTGLSVCAVSETERRAGDLLREELFRRTRSMPSLVTEPTSVCIRLVCSDTIQDKDSFTIMQKDRLITIEGRGIRALIYGYSMFLRKTEYRDGKITLVEPIVGTYVPDKTIRGHQLGYRGISNTYDAWSLEDYRRYYLDLMAFGCNTVEHIPGLGSEKTKLMQYDPDELCVQASALADSFDLDVSLWIPNDDLPPVESAALREAFFRRCPRIDAVFPPGGDPGHYPADAFIERVRIISRALKKSHPDAEMWPSAQAPHSMPDWGDVFIRETEKKPQEIDGVITGPNRAFPLDVLRKKLPAEYPIRLYPDLTHNVRCEYPVHALQDDWHYALAATLSRESINPRAQEYRLIHRLTRPYVVGSVSYSEGVNDDVNKMVWSDMDFDPDCDLRTTLLDYARVFLWQAPADRIADAILALEANWIGDPVENPHIESTLEMLESLSAEYPTLCENWRFNQLLFRASCDAYVRRRRSFDLSLLAEARSLLSIDAVQQAQDTLRTAYPDSILDLRKRLFDLAQRLYDQIGMQLDIAHFGASAWERGATLETIDLPVTDKEFYLNRLAYLCSVDETDRPAYLRGLLDRSRAPKGGYYFSFAEHGLDAPGERQTPDFYMDFQGDRPGVNDGSIPMAQLKLFDHFSFRCKIGGFIPGRDYKLRVSYSSRKTESVRAHSVKLNGHVIYCGAQYGGEKDAKFDSWYLAPNTESATYLLPADCFENGCGELLIEEPTVGVMLSEFWIFPAEG